MKSYISKKQNYIGREKHLFLEMKFKIKKYNIHLTLIKHANNKKSIKLEKYKKIRNEIKKYIELNLEKNKKIINLDYFSSQEYTTINPYKIATMHKQLSRNEKVDKIFYRNRVLINCKIL